MRRIPLTRGKFVIVDEDTFIWLSKLNCFCRGDSRKPYAAFIKNINGSKVELYVHRVIMNAKSKQIVDHSNQNSLDCRRKNLRIVSHRNNILNSSVLNRRKIGVRGTYQTSKSSWIARLRIGNNKRKQFGPFRYRYQASLAYEKALKKYSNV
jgi:hypothetical protein